MKTVYDALDPIVNGSATTKEKGDKYEAACVYYLKNTDNGNRAIDEGYRRKCA